MKLLFDENLSSRLPEQLSDLYPGSVHVRQCGLASAGDAAIWEYAKSHGFVIVSKDSDFEERSILSGAPPKIVCIRAGNCSTKDIEDLLRSANARLTRLVEEDHQETCLILRHQQDQD